MPREGIPLKARLRGGRKTWAKGLRSELYGDLGVFVLGYAMATAVVYVWTYFTVGPSEGVLKGALVGIPIGFSTGLLMGVVPALVFHFGARMVQVTQRRTVIRHRRSWCLIAGLFTGGQLLFFPEAPPLILIWGGMPLALGLLGARFLPAKTSA